MNRSLLAKHRLAEFTEWLTSKGVPHRPGRGDFQKLQVQTKERGWQCIFYRGGAKEHYTVAGPLEAIVREFISETKKVDT
jgi:hypothetical protein